MLRLTSSRSVALRRALSTAAPAAEDANAAFKRKVGTGILAGVVGSTTCLTGWQLNRYQWKKQLIEERKAILHREPRPLLTLVPELLAGQSADPQAIANSIETHEFNQVACEGEFDHTCQVLLGPRSAPPGAATGPPGAPGAGTGFDVLTPLQCADGTRVIVNRGWVPRAAGMDPAAGGISAPKGVQRVRGILRRGEARNKYAHNTLKTGEFAWLDLDTLAYETESAPVLVVATTTSDEARPSGGGSGAAAAPMLRPLDTFVNFYVEPSMHLVYAATWGSLSLAGAYMTLRFRRGY